MVIAILFILSFLSVIDAQSLFDNCHEDRVRLCATIPPPFNEQKLFTSKCFKSNYHSLSNGCRVMMGKYLNKHLNEEKKIEKVKAAVQRKEVLFGDMKKPNLKLVDLTKPIVKHEEEKKPRGTLKENCHLDRLRLCPKIGWPFSPRKLFTHSCFIKNKNLLSSGCRSMMDYYLVHALSAQKLPIQDQQQHQQQQYHQQQQQQQKHVPELAIEKSLLYRYCHEDRVKLCPAILPPFSPQKLFTDSCFQTKKEQLSPLCREEMKVYLRAAHVGKQQQLHQHQQQQQQQQQQKNQQQHQLSQSHHQLSQTHHQLPQLPQRPSGSLYQNCHYDRLRLCPQIPGPYTPKRLFTHPCFHEKASLISRGCFTMMNYYLAKSSQYSGEKIEKHNNSYKTHGMHMNKTHGMAHYLSYLTFRPVRHAIIFLLFCLLALAYFQHSKAKAAAATTAFDSPAGDKKAKKCDSSEEISSSSELFSVVEEDRPFVV